MKCDNCDCKSDNTINDACVACMADKCGNIVETLYIHKPICIDLRGQGAGWNFAFFNTKTNRFIEIYGKSVWNTFDDLADDLRLEAYDFCADSGESIRRYYGLCPDWVKELGVSTSTQQHRDIIYNL